MKNRGYFGLVMYHPKFNVNWGSLIRTANILNASFIACIGPRFKAQCSDTLKTHKHVPIFEYKTFEDFKNNLPYGCEIVAVELDKNSKPLKSFVHPERAVYLMGAEDHGIPESILSQCHHIVQLEGDRSLNVAVAGSIVLYHREAL